MESSSSSEQQSRIIQSKTCIFDVASHLVECVEQAERIYFTKDSVFVSELWPIWGLSKCQDALQLSIRPRAEVFLNPVQFLTILKDVLVSESDKEFEGSTYCSIVVSLNEIQQIRLQVWKDIEKEDHTYSLKIESPECEILKVALKADAEETSVERTNSTKNKE